MHDDAQRLDGPLRGTSAWWRGLGAAPGPDLTAAGDPPSSPDHRTARDDSRAGIRWDLVERVRGEIAAGTYDTQERWDAALDRLLDQLGAD